MLIFEETIAGAPVSPIEIRITLGGPNSVQVKAHPLDADSSSVVIVLPDGKRWKMTPRLPDEPKTGIIWTGSPSTEWIVRSAA